MTAGLDGGAYWRFIRRFGLRHRPWGNCSSSCCTEYAGSIQIISSLHNIFMNAESVMHQCTVYARNGINWTE